MGAGASKLEISAIMNFLGLVPYFNLLVICFRTLWGWRTASPLQKRGFETCPRVENRPPPWLPSFNLRLTRDDGPFSVAVAGTWSILVEWPWLRYSTEYRPKTRVQHAPDDCELAWALTCHLTLSIDISWALARFIELSRDQTRDQRRKDEKQREKDHADKAWKVGRKNKRRHFILSKTPFANKIQRTLQANATLSCTTEPIFRSWAQYHDNDLEWFWCSPCSIATWILNRLLGQCPRTVWPE